MMGILFTTIKILTGLLTLCVGIYITFKLWKKKMRVYAVWVLVTSLDLGIRQIGS